MPRLNLLFLQRDELYFSRRCVQLQRRTAAVQVTLGIDLPWAVVAALRLNANAGQFAMNCIFAVGDVDAGMNADLQVRRKIHDDVTNSGVERGVAELAIHGHEFGGNSAGSGLGAHAVADFEAMNAAAAGLRLDGATPSGEANAAAASLDIHGSRDAANFNIASAGRSTQIAADALYRNIPAAGLDDGVALHVLDVHGFAAGRSTQLAAHRANIHASAAGTNSQIGIYGADVDCAAARAHRTVSVDVVEVYGAAARFGIDAAIQMRELQVATIGLGLHHVNIARSGNDEFNRTAMPIAGAFAAEVRGVALAAGDYAQ